MPKSFAKKQLTPKKETSPQLPRVTVDHVNEFVREVAGEEGLKIVSCMGDCGTTDDKIEQNTKMKIAEIRSVLNHLHSYGLVEYSREKNLQTGWFTYTWKLNTNRALQNFLNSKKREYEQLRVQLARGEGGQVYRCTKNCGCFEFEKAVENSFRCPSCRGKLNSVDQDEELQKLERKITTLSGLVDSSTLKPQFSLKA
ncbi:MAG: hypothetical protein V1722_02820 [Candidatus Micrarchaeota archaeon]